MENTSFHESLLLIQGTELSSFKKKQKTFPCIISLKIMDHTLNLIALILLLCERPSEMFNRGHQTMAMFSSIYLQLFFMWHGFKPSYHLDYFSFVCFGFATSLKAFYWKPKIALKEWYNLDRVQLKAKRRRDNF